MHFEPIRVVRLQGPPVSPIKMKAVPLLLIAALSMHGHATPSGRHDCPRVGKSVPAASVKIDFLGAGSEVQFHSLADAEGLRAFLAHAGRERAYIDEIPSEGGPPIIESVFTDQADSDPAKELFVLVRWEVRHYGLQTEGNLFELLIYDDALTAGGCGLKQITRLARSFGTGFDGLQEGTRVHYRFKNAPAIRKHLRALGFNK